MISRIGLLTAHCGAQDLNCRVSGILPAVSRLLWVLGNKPGSSCFKCNIGVLPVCISASFVCSVHRGQKGIRSPGTGIKNVLFSHVGAANRTKSSLKEQQVFLNCWAIFLDILFFFHSFFPFFFSFFEGVGESVLGQFLSIVLAVLGTRTRWASNSELKEIHLPASHHCWAICTPCENVFLW